MLFRLGFVRKNRLTANELNSREDSETNSAKKVSRMKQNEKNDEETSDNLSQADEILF